MLEPRAGARLGLGRGHQAGGGKGLFFGATSTKAVRKVGSDDEKAHEEPERGEKAHGGALARETSATS